ncbi:MAG: radical SAM protein, partial [Planctomycetota bacterium]
MTDKTYDRVPSNMSPTTFGQLIERIDDYCESMCIDEFHLTLHGGEPLMWPSKYFTDSIPLIRRSGRIRATLQTNASLPFDLSTMQLLSDYGIRIGISLDGPEKYNDIWRIDKKGRGSYSSVMNFVKELDQNNLMSNLGGFLSVINTDIAPREYFDWVMDLPKKRIDVLMPIDINYSNFDKRNDGRIGQWLAELFDIWFLNDDPEVYIRTFSSTVELMCGGSNHTDKLVNDSIPMFVI